MELEHVHEFVTLAETKNYLKTANQLFISQSALSRHIQSMEKDLGAPLFTRTSRSTELTEYGRIFLPYAQKLLAVQYEYNTALYNHMKNIGGTITIGSLPVTAPYHIPEILAKFSRENKNFRLTVVQNDDLDLLRSRRADFIFFRDTTNETFSDIAFYPFDIDHLVAILPLDHPLANARFLHLEQLRDEQFLLLPKNTQMYNMCLQICQKANFTPHVLYSGPSAENIITLVKEHAGIGLLTRKPLAYHDLRHVALVDILPQISTTICLAYLKDKPLSVGAMHFINCVKAFNADLNQAEPARAPL